MLFKSFTPARYSKRTEYKTLIQDGGRNIIYAEVCKNCGCAYGKHYGSNQAFCPPQYEIDHYKETLLINSNSIVI